MKLRRILHATDFSPASLRAFATALDLPRRSRAELLLAHVVAMPEPLLEDAYPSAESYGEVLERGLQVSRRRLNALCRRAQQRGVRARALVLDGIPPSLSRCLVCREPSPDLICGPCRARIRGEALRRKQEEERAGRTAH